MKAKSVLVAHTLVVLVAGSNAAAQLMEEVVVTAQKREQAISDVSISVHAWSGDQLRSLGIDEARDIDGYVSNVDIKMSNQGDVNPVITVRGVGLNNFNSNNNPSVGIYMDEVYLSSPSMLSLFMVDVDRVELLKGPQGTLYGRNSSGGAFNIHSNKPTQDLDGFINITVASFGTTKVEGAIGKGLTDNTSGRVSYYYENQNESFFEDSVSGERLDGIERYGVRAQLAYDGDKLHSNLGVFYFDHSGTNQLQQLAGTGDPVTGGLCADATAILDAGRGEMVPGLCVDLVGYRESSSDPFKNGLDPALRDRLRIDTNLFGTTLKIDYDFGQTTLTSITGFLAQERLYGEGLTTPGGMFFTQHDEDVKQLSQELRLSGTFGNGHSWIAGMFYSNDNIKTRNPFESPGLFGPFFGVSPLIWLYDQDTTAAAAFGSIDWTISDTVTLSTGLRYSSEEVEFAGGTTAFIPGGPVTTTTDVFAALPEILTDPEFAIPLTSIDESVEDDHTLFRVALEFRPSDDWLAYVSASSGFKSGGFYGDFTVDPEELAPFDSETIVAFEAGSKLTFAGGRAQLNAAAFYYDYRDIQTFVPSIIGFKFDNVEKAEVVGLDLDLITSPSDGFDLVLGIGWNDSEFKSQFANLDGNKLPNAPEFQANGLARYEFSITNSMNLGIQADFKYSDSKFTEATNNGLNFAGEYTVWNGQLFLTPVDGQWTLSIWGRNLSDEQYFEDVNFVDVANVVQQFAGTPRMAGVTFSYAFN